MDLSNKKALVTGASSGIGLEMAIVLASMKCSLVLVSRSTDKLNKLKKEIIKKYHVVVDVVPADLSKRGSAEMLYKKCLKMKLQVDILVNNAGVGLFGTACCQELGKTMDMVDLNVSSLTALSILFARDMSIRKYGRILNVGSMVGYMPMPFFAAYGATKSYVKNFSLALRAELKGTGVTVTCLEPGFVKTNFDKAAEVTHGKYAAFSEASGMDARTVAQIGVKALLRRKAFVVAGFKNKISAWVVSIVPKTWIAAVFFGFIKKLIGSK